MGHQLRWLPPSETGWTTVELTTRTVKRLLLLRPTPKLRRRIIGILARAQKQTGVRVHIPSYLSNHGQLQASVQTVEQMAEFMCYVNGNIAKEVCHLVDWQDKVWARRFKHSVLSEEPEIQIKRFRYLLAQGTLKEGLVASPLDWPGVTAAHALVDGRMEIHGEWVDRTAMHKAREKGRDVCEEDYTYEETLELSPLPCLEDLSRQEYAAWVREMVKDIEAETRAMHEANGTEPLGADAVCAKDPFDTPAPAKRSPAPMFLTATREAFEALRAAYRQVVAAFMEASERFRGGEAGVVFPEGTFPAAGRPLLYPSPRGPDP